MRKLLRITGYVSGALFGVLLLALLYLSLPQSGWRALSVQTGSMVPTFDPGALVLVHKVPPETLKKGDIITYKDSKGGKTITHRIINFQHTGSQRMFVVKGDANQNADSPVLASQIVGKEVKSVPYAGRIIDFSHTPLGLILLVYIPAVLLIIYEIKLMSDRLTQYEINRRRAIARETAKKIYHGVRPNTPSRPAGPHKPISLLIAFGLFIALGFMVKPAYAQLSSGGATLTGTTIKTAPVSHNPGGSDSGSQNNQVTCTSNTNVNVSDSSDQTAASGNASTGNNTNGGQASSGSASNSNSSSTSINVSNNC